MKNCLTVIGYVFTGVLVLIAVTSFTAGLDGSTPYYKNTKTGCYKMDSYGSYYNPFYQMGCFLSKERKELK